LRVSAPPDRGSIHGTRFSEGTLTDLAMEYGALRQAVSDLRTVRGDLTQRKQHLHDSFGGFLGSGWTGAAADSFRDGWSTWTQGVDDVLSALDSMAELLTENSRAFRTNDELTGTTMDLLHDRLGAGS
jgi:WXG100 family type VII secretion target